MVRYDKKILSIGIALIGLTILGIIAFTYAFFTAGVEGNQNANETIIETADLRLVFNDTEIITLDNALPGASSSKTFTVENIGNADISYDIELVDVTNAFSNDELIYTITSDNDGGTATNEVVPEEDEALISNITVGAGITQTYTITIKFIETGSNQNSNQEAEFAGKLQIVPRIMGVALAGYVYDENDDPMSNVTVEVHSDPISVITDEIGYYEISDIPVGVHTIYIKDGETTLGSKEVTLLLSNESIIEATNTLKLPKEANKYTNLKLDSGLININLAEKPITIKEQILADNVAQSDELINFDSITGNGFYYTADEETNGEDEERIYYFRGRVENNWVSFAGYLWRIVRTTSEGGVKLIYSGDGEQNSSAFINTSTAFNTNSSTKYRVGYTYNPGGYTETQTDSTIKAVVDGWYNGEDGIKEYEEYLSTTAVYCADRSSEIVNESYIYYPARDRIITNYRPTYKCPWENASRYTIDSSRGNGYLLNPIAMLSADEINYAGVRWSSSNESLNSYIMDNAKSNNWWAMTPYYFNGSSAYNFRVFSSGYLINNSVSGVGTNGVRPAISLKSSVVYTGGDGSKLNPYTVE